jgi:hypothetical membrane protein
MMNEAGHVPIAANRVGADTSPSASALTRVLLACGVVGPPLFIVTFLIEGATRPHYSAWRNYVSSLGAGPGGAAQVANFIVYGLLSVAFVVGLRRVFSSGKGSIAGPFLLGIYGLGLLVAGVFVTDPSLGYPPNPPTSALHTVHGMIHGLAGLAVFTSLAAASFALARRFAGNPAWRGWAVYSLLTGAMVIVFFVVSTVSSVLDEVGSSPNGLTGLFQRIAIIVGWSWIALLAARLLREAMPSRR